MVVAIIQLVGASFSAERHFGSTRALDAAAIVLLLAGPVALTQRRRWTPHVLIFVFLVTVAYHLLDYPHGPVGVSLIVALVAALFHGYRTFAWATAAASYFALVWGPYLAGVEPRPELAEALGIAAWVAAGLAFFEMGRGRRERRVQAARARREEKARRASEERLRIARELHDVLAHNISLINVQAGVALHLMDEKPDQARTSLTAIKDASNAALSELRSVLDILREGGEVAPRAPAPRLDDLDDLIEGMRAAGLVVTKTVEGDPRLLPANVERAAFRISQEALTNVTRHARAHCAAIVIDYRPDEVLLEISDDGRGATAAPSGGKGIAGMRERAAALEGDLEAGPRPGGGFLVKARLPIPDEDDR